MKIVFYLLRALSSALGLLTHPGKNVVICMCACLLIVLYLHLGAS